MTEVELYYRGLIKACMDRGIDPAQLVKQAGLPASIMGASNLAYKGSAIDALRGGHGGGDGPVSATMHGKHIANNVYHGTEYAEMAHNGHHLASKVKPIGNAMSRVTRPVARAVGGVAKAVPTVSKGVSGFSKALGPAAWAASYGLDAGNHMYSDGHGGMNNNIGENITRNSKHQLVTEGAKSLPSRVVNGFFNPMSSIMSAGSGIQRTGSALGDAAKSRGLGSTMKNFMTNDVLNQQKANDPNRFMPPSM